MKENKILIDWLAFTVHYLTLDDVFQLLGFTDIVNDFEMSNGSNGYKDRYYYDGISIHFNGREDMGIHINMSGQGCRVFETYSDYGDFNELLLRCSELQKFNITRLDVAYDDFNNYLPIDEIVRCVHHQEWLSPSNMKWWEAVYSSAGISAYIGSPRSNIRFRFYDKGAEKHQDYQWTRLEIQLRDVAALMFAYKWIIEKHDINILFFEVINKYIKFIELDNTRKTRCSVKPWWNDFLQTYDSVCLRLPGTEYNLSNLNNMVINKSGNAIQALIAIYGISNLLQRLNEEKPIRNAPKKYKQLMKSYIDDYSKNHEAKSYIEKLSDGSVIEHIEDLPVKLQDVLYEL